MCEGEGGEAAKDCGGGGLNEGRPGVLCACNGVPVLLHHMKRPQLIQQAPRVNLRSTPLMLLLKDCLDMHQSLHPSLIHPHISTTLLSSSHSPRYSKTLASHLQTPLVVTPKNKKLTVDAQLAVPNHLLNLPLLLQIIQRLPRQAAVDLEPVHERGDGDEAVRLHVLVQFVRGRFVEDDGVIGLVLYCLREREQKD